MKLKKKTSILMAASAAVAVVGIAAVSFAAWQSSNTTSFAVQAATGYLKTFGFTDDVTDAKDLGTLVPYDQGNDGQNTEFEGVKFVSIPLPAYFVEESVAYTISVASTSELSFYVQIGAEVEEAPTSVDGWTKVTADGAEAYSGTGTGAQVSDLYISFILDSGDVAQQNQTAEFTVNLSK